MHCYTFNVRVEERWVDLVQGHSKALCLFLMLKVLNCLCWNNFAIRSYLSKDTLRMDDNSHWLHKSWELSGVLTPRNLTRSRGLWFQRAHENWSYNRQNIQFDLYVPCSIQCTSYKLTYLTTNTHLCSNIIRYMCFPVNVPHLPSIIDKISLIPNRIRNKLRVIQFLYEW